MSRGGVAQVFRVSTDSRCGQLSLILDALVPAGVPGYRGLLLADTYRHLTCTDGLIHQTRLLLDQLRWPAVYDMPRHQFTFENGSTLDFSFCTEDATWPYRYGGATFHFIGFEGARKLRGEQYRYMFSRLRNFNMPMLDHSLRVSVLFEPETFQRCEWLHTIPSTNLTVTQFSCPIH